jgi:hypothetical protein
MRPSRLCHPALLIDRQHRAGTARFADSFAAAVYGSIVAAGLLAALRQADASAIGSALSLLSTMAVFWLAHVWSQITGERIYHGRRFTSQLALAIARSEWPLVEAAFGPTVILLLGWAGLITDRLALTTALAICVVQLLGWGFVVGRRAFSRWYYAALSAVANGLLGLALVVLETIVLH